MIILNTVSVMKFFLLDPPPPQGNGKDIAFFMNKECSGDLGRALEMPTLLYMGGIRGNGYFDGNDYDYYDSGRKVFVVGVIIVKSGGKKQNCG